MYSDSLHDPRPASFVEAGFTIQRPKLVERPELSFWLILLSILLIHIPFFFIHHVQEDAYITFRSAKHLAEQGDLSFNLRQHYPGTTSLLYVLVVAAIDFLLRGYLILGVQVLGTLCVATGSFFAVRAFTRSVRETCATSLLLACLPVSLVVSYTGMETPLLFLALGFCIYTLASDRYPGLFLASLFTLPLIRPDAIAYGIILCAALSLVDRRRALQGSILLATGAGTMMLLNYLTSGRYLPPTMTAKLIAYHPSHQMTPVLARIRDVLLHQSFLLPVSTSYLVKAAPFLLLLTITACIFSLRLANTTRIRITLACIAVMAFAIPLSYAYGGVIFDWYLFPANWLAMILIVITCVRVSSRSRYPQLAWTLICILWIGLAMLQAARSLTEATQDFHYRADIGRYLQGVSHGQGTLFLEPAGYIPFYSGLKTDDEVGLVSDRVLHYMKQDPSNWWIGYVRAENPTYIVQRESFEHYQIFNGSTLSQEDQKWFASHYLLVRRTRYDPQLYHQSPLLLKILKLGPMPDYLVYERVGAHAISPMSD